MKGYIAVLFFIICFFYSPVLMAQGFLGGQGAQGSQREAGEESTLNSLESSLGSNLGSNLESSEQVDDLPEEFDPSILNHPFLVTPNVDFRGIDNFFTFPNALELYLDVNFALPNFSIDPFFNTGLGFSPLSYFYGGGVKFSFVDLLLGLGYFGSFRLNFSLNNDSLTIATPRDFTNFFYFESGFNFFLLVFRNYLGYGYGEVTNLVDETTGNVSSRIGEQIINNADIIVYFLSNLNAEISLDIDLNYQYFLEEEVSDLQFFVSLRNIFKLENYMEIALTPKFFTSFASNKDKVRNFVSFFQYSPQTLFYIDNISVDTNRLSGNYIAGLDLAWRIFPFTSILGPSLFKNIYFQPSFYGGYVVNDSDNADPLRKSEATISAVLNIGRKNPYNEGRFALGIGWNNFEGLVFNLAGSAYY